MRFQKSASKCLVAAAPRCWKIFAGWNWFATDGKKSFARAGDRTRVIAPNGLPSPTSRATRGEAPIPFEEFVCSTLATLRIEESLASGERVPVDVACISAASHALTESCNSNPGRMIRSHTRTHRRDQLVHAHFGPQHVSRRRLGGDRARWRSEVRHCRRAPEPPQAFRRISGARGQGLPGCRRREDFRRRACRRRPGQRRESRQESSIRARESGKDSEFHPAAPAQRSDARCAFAAGEGA